MKQDLTSRFDFSTEKMYIEIDDCGIGFIDAVAMKRFIKKCGVIPNDQLITSIIRRYDLD
jgi:hypothetical protein